MNESARIAVVGVGYWGPNLVRNFLADERVLRLVICDPDRERVRKVQRDFPRAEACEDFREVLGDTDVDAVAIATPVRLHHELAKAALQAGKHVLVEKPLTTSSREAEELMDLAARRGLVLMVDHTFVFTGAVEKIVEICSRDLGDFYYIDSVRINLGLFQHDVNVIWDLATHDLSIAQHVLRRQPKVVHAVGGSHTESGLADVAHLTLDYGDSIMAHFHVNWLSPTKIRQMIVAGSKRMIVWNDLDPAEKLRVYDKGIQVSQREADRHSLQVGYRSGDAWLPRVDGTEALRKMTAHFIDCFTRGTTCVAGGKEGLDVVRVLEASELSLSNNGRPVALEGASSRLA